MPADVTLGVDAGANAAVADVLEPRRLIQQPQEEGGIGERDGAQLESRRDEFRGQSAVRQ
jgi:hypothetical protein